MQHISAIGYLLTGLFFLVLAFLLAINWQKKLQGIILLIASLLTSIWAGLLAWQLVYNNIHSHVIWITESLRSLGWLSLLAYLLWELYKQNNNSKKWLKLLISLFVSLSAIQLFPYETVLVDTLGLDVPYLNDLRIIFYLTLSIIGISLVEQFFRNTSAETRSIIKYLCLGLGLGFFYDFYLYADALLFKRIDPLIWESRGAINALIAPLVAVSVRRNPDWSLTVFVSKQVVFHTTGILGAGIYLLSMASIGYYIKYVGGEYGDFFRIVFFTSAIVMLFILISSGQFRAKLKVFLNKNFFQYQYDYRDEWLNLINSLSSIDDSQSLYQRVIKVMTSIMDSAYGSLWKCRDEGCRCIATNNANVMEVEPSQWRNTLAFLNNTNWIIDLDEYKNNRSIYENLQLPESVLQNEDAWLIVPLIHEEQLHSFVILSRSSSVKTLNWENRDLLIMAGRQAASYMVLEEAANALAEAQQFEGFNRLSAFVIHDLKNLIAQLSLVTSNAARHKHNPAFVDDVIVTIENSVGKMNRLMLQLKSAGVTEKRKAVDIVRVIEDVINEKQRQLPRPSLLNLLKNSVPLKAETERLSAIIGHIIQNAQDATPDDGSIDVILEETGHYLQITVRDTGAGMDETFIQKRLFKPFDTTKGLTGMGIGAYECKEFIQSMNGEIQVRSKSGEGTDFIIRIPVDRESFHNGEKIG